MVFLDKLLKARQWLQCGSGSGGDNGGGGGGGAPMDTTTGQAYSTAYSEVPYGG